MSPFSENAAQPKPESDPAPSEKELLAMAYFDGELGAEQRATFEQRLLSEPSLARELAEYQKLEILARLQAPPEPIDAEWARLNSDPFQMALKRAGMLLFFSGSLTLGIAVVMSVLAAPLFAVLLRVGFLGMIVGLLALLIASLRQRLREQPYDPYVHIKR
jgi:anti-sigma factor RsiW